MNYESRKYYDLLYDVLKLARETYLDTKFMWIIEDSCNYELICNRDCKWCNEKTDEFFKLIFEKLPYQESDFPSLVSFIGSDILEQMQDGIDILKTTEDRTILNVITRSLIKT